MTAIADCAVSINVAAQIDAADDFRRMNRTKTMRTVTVKAFDFDFFDIRQTSFAKRIRCFVFHIAINCT